MVFMFKDYIVKVLSLTIANNFRSVIHIIIANF